jgi:beta-galactosidase
MPKSYCAVGQWLRHLSSVEGGHSDECAMELGSALHCSLMVAALFTNPHTEPSTGALGPVLLLIFACFSGPLACDGSRGSEGPTASGGSAARGGTSGAGGGGTSRGGTAGSATMGGANVASGGTAAGANSGAGATAPAGGSGAGGALVGGAGGAAGSASGGAAGSASGGAAGSNGGAGASGGAGNLMSETLVNRYDGARATTVSFDLGWKFHLGDVSGAEASAFDDSAWTSLDVPHDWSISLPFNQNSPTTFEGGYLDGGLGWYRKSFTLPATSSTKRVIVQFDGVYMDSTLYLNGVQVYARPYGYSSFEVDLTANAKFGASNVLAVKVNNQTPSSRWYSGSGIYRHTWLKTVNPVRVAYTGTQVTTSMVSASSATVNISVTVQNGAAADQVVTLTSSVRDAAGTELGKVTSAATAVPAGKTATVVGTVTVPNPKLWSPAAPNLYSALTTVSVAEAEVDAYTTPFGIRSFAFDANTGFSLNGKSLKINGVCNHHDLGALGSAVNYRAMEKRLQLLKDMGANAFRTSHNPPAPELLDLADRMGFLVMAEAFDCWYAGKHTYDYGRFFKQWADTDIGDFVSRDRNHPAVIIWSIGNEVAQAGDKTAVQKLIDDIRAKDASRVITQAYAAWVNAGDITGLEDIVGINYAPDRYDSVHTAHPTYKMIGSETSSAFRSRGVYASGNNQESSYDDSAAGWGHTAETSWKNVNSRAWIAGEFVWTGFDYIGEPTPYEWPSKSSYFGIIDSADFPKDIFYFYQSKWNASGPAMVHIVPMNWTDWTAGKAVKVLVYTNADSVELFLNGQSQGSKTMDPAAAKLQWSVPFAAGTLEAKATKGGAVVATDKVQTAGAAAALTSKADRSSIAADGRDLSYVGVNIVDAQGVVVPRAGNKIDFTIEGPGTLVGLDGGDSTNHDPYQGTSHAAFNGKLMAIVRSTTTAGTITLKASSGSLRSSSAVIMTMAP